MYTAKEHTTNRERVKERARGREGERASDSLKKGRTSDINEL